MQTFEVTPVNNTYDAIRLTRTDFLRDKYNRDVYYNPSTGDYLTWIAYDDDVYVPGDVVVLYDLHFEVNTVEEFNRDYREV